MLNNAPFPVSSVFGWRRDPVGDALVTKAQQEKDQRCARVAEAWDRYWGKHPLPLTRTATDPKAADNTIVNMARKTVDISAFYLFGKDVEFEVGDEKAIKSAAGGVDNSPPEDEWLEQAWKVNRVCTLLLEFATAGGVAGDGYFRLYPANALAGEVYPRVVMLDAEHVDVMTDPVDYNKPVRFTVEFNSVDLEAQKATLHRHRIERQGTGWVIIEEEKGTQGATWAEVGREAWPYPFPPIFHTKNLPAPHQYFGRSDIEEDVLKLNDAISFVVSNINRILRVHGHPQIYITGQGAPDGAAVDRAIDSVKYLPNPDANVGATPYVENLAAHFDQLQRLRDAYHELTMVPEIATGKVDSIGQLSGIALQILYGPLVQMTEVKRKFYGEMLVDLCRAMLALGEQDATLPIEVKWPQILPSNRKEEAETAIALKEVGVSEETVIGELGYDAATEMERAKTEAKDKADALAVTFDAGGLPGNPPIGAPAGPPNA